MLLHVSYGTKIDIRAPEDWPLSSLKAEIRVRFAIPSNHQFDVANDGNVHRHGQSESTSLSSLYIEDGNDVNVINVHDGSSQ